VTDDARVVAIGSAKDRATSTSQRLLVAPGGTSCEESFDEARQELVVVERPQVREPEHEGSEPREARGSADWHHLPPREARALDRISMGEHEHEEAAEALGVSWVHVLAHRARTRLRARTKR